MGFLIKRLDANHVNEVVAISQSVEEFTTSQGEDHWSYEELTNWLSNPLDCCVGAFSDNYLVGYCLSHLHTAANKIHVENIFVQPAFRRLGVGKLLIKALVEFYQGNSKDRLRFFGAVRRDNEPARLFFERVGFNRGHQFIWLQK